MFKKLLLAVATLIATMGFAFAQVDVNKADQATLDGVKGIGPKISKMILDERKKNGNFKDWADFESRVKGIGEKSASNLSQAGLTVNGQAKPNAPAARNDKKDKQPSTSAKADTRKDMKEDKGVASAKSDAKKDTKKDTKEDAAKGQKADKSSASAPAKK